MKEGVYKTSIDKRSWWWSERRQMCFDGVEKWLTLVTVLPKKTYREITTTSQKNSRFAFCNHGYSHEISLLTDNGWFKEKEGEFTDREHETRIKKMERKKTSKKKKNSHKKLHETEVDTEFGVHKPREV